MAFINVNEALPKKEGVYRIMVDSINKKEYETEAKWSMEAGFNLIEGKLEDDAYIASWWTTDNIR